MNFVRVSSLFMSVLFIFSGVSGKDKHPELTQALQEEIARGDNPIATERTHPQLYQMIKRMVEKFGIAVIKAIHLHPIRSQRVTKEGQVITEYHDSGVTINFLGDICICRELITQLTYDELEALVAIAIANKACNVPTKLGVTFVSTLLATFGLAAAAYYSLDESNPKKLFDRKTVRNNIFGVDTSLNDKKESLELVWGWFFVPAGIATKFVANNTQKSVDKKAAQLIGTARVIAAIKARAQFESSYVAEGLFDRALSALCLKGVVDTLTYPFRSFNDDERIAYLTEK